MRIVIDPDKTESIADSKFVVEHRRRNTDVLRRQFYYAADAATVTAPVMRRVYEAVTCASTLASTLEL